MSYTKGPWCVRKWGNVLDDDWPELRTSIASKENGEALFINARYANNVDANANLIAAAPELLEALEASLEWIDSVPDNTALPIMPGFDRDWVDEIRAKAKGKL